LGAVGGFAAGMGQRTMTAKEWKNILGLLK